MLKKAYIEISNLCNLSCSFCPGTSRPAGSMSPESFRLAAEKLRGRTRFLYFHLMGEPLLHPRLGELLSIAGESGFRVVITTNGTLLGETSDVLLSSPALHRLNISLQSHEAGDCRAYVSVCAAAAKAAAEKGVICCFRLWNGGGEEGRNREILSALREHFPGKWSASRQDLVLGDRIFLEHGERFDWPVQTAPGSAPPRFCYGLRDQIGVLWDGTVVPCCLDSEGSMPLGNLFERELEDILASPRAAAIYEGFSRGEAVEETCRRCGYASRF